MGSNPKSEIPNPKFSSLVDQKNRSVSRRIGFGTAEADPTGQGRQLGFRQRVLGKLKKSETILR
jgi:hypothetical protein